MPTDKQMSFLRVLITKHKMTHIITEEIISNLDKLKASQLISTLKETVREVDILLIEDIINNKTLRISKVNYDKLKDLLNQSRNLLEGYPYMFDFDFSYENDFVEDDTERGIEGVLLSNEEAISLIKAFEIAIYLEEKYNGFESLFTLDTKSILYNLSDPLFLKTVLYKKYDKEHHHNKSHAMLWYKDPDGTALVRQCESFDRIIVEDIRRNFNTMLKK